MPDLQLGHESCREAYSWSILLPISSVALGSDTSQHELVII